MNRAPLIFLGIFCALAFSWTGVVLTNELGYGGLTPYFAPDEARIFPQPAPGVARRGKAVYQDLGCITCHTQQVRRAGFGADIERGWGERQSVARDYIREDRVLLGSSRIGPDLRNVGARLADPNWHLLHLYDPQITTPGSTMPPHPFLFETRQVIGERSNAALDLPPSHAPDAGFEVIPTERAEALAAYLVSLNDTYAYPETNNVYPGENADEAAAGHGPAAESPAAEGAH